MLFSIFLSSFIVSTYGLKNYIVSNYCNDILITSTENKPILVKTEDPRVSWYGEKELLISSKDPKFRLGEITINHDVSIEEITLVNKYQHNFNLAHSNAFYDFEFCVEGKRNITILMSHEQTICPSVIISKYPSPNNRTYSWSASCDILSIQNSGWFYGSLNSWCTPDEWCLDKNNCYSCDFIKNNSVELTIYTNGSYVEGEIHDEPIKSISIIESGGFNCSNPVNHYYEFSILENCQDISIELKNKKGQQNILVSQTPYPSYDTQNWPDWWWGDNSVYLSKQNKGTYYITVFPYCGIESYVNSNPNPEYVLSIRKIKQKVFEEEIQTDLTKMSLCIDEKTLLTIYTNHPILITDDSYSSAGIIVKDNGVNYFENNIFIRAYFDNTRINIFDTHQKYNMIILIVVFSSIGLLGLIIYGIHRRTNKNSMTVTNSI